MLTSLSNASLITPDVKDKQSCVLKWSGQILISNILYVVGQRGQGELNSTVIRTEVTGHFNGKVRG